MGVNKDIQEQEDKEFVEELDKAVEDHINRHWHELTQYQREYQTDQLLAVLRKSLIQSDAVFTLSESMPTHNVAGGIRYVGIYTTKLEITVGMKPFCRICGNTGRVPMLGIHEPSKWPKCTCRRKETDEE